MLQGIMNHMFFSASTVTPAPTVPDAVKVHEAALGFLAIANGDENIPLDPPYPGPSPWRGMIRQVGKLWRIFRSTFGHAELQSMQPSKCEAQLVLDALSVR